MEWARRVARVVVAGGALMGVDEAPDDELEYVSTPSAITPSCATATEPDTSTLIGLDFTDMLPVVGRVLGLLLSIISCSTTPDVSSVPKLFATLPSTLTTADGTRKTASSLRGMKGLLPVSPLCTLLRLLVVAAQVDPVTFKDDMETLIRLRLLPRVTYARFPETEKTEALEAIHLVSTESSNANTVDAGVALVTTGLEPHMLEKSSVKFSQWV